MKRWIIRLLIGMAAGGALGVLALFGVLAYQAVNLPLPDHMLAPGRQASLVLHAADGTPLGGAGVRRGEVVRVEDLPQHVIDAFLAIEDRRFYEHAGIDVFGIMRAGLANLRARAITEGGSTITQQLARTMFLTPDRTIRRKIHEMMIALWLERRLSKDEILARYLNSIYFGGGAWGIDGAARRYFGKPARELSLPEAAILAGLIRAPSFYAPTRDLKASRQRAEVVLDAMVGAGMLDAGEAARAKAAPVKLVQDQRLAGGRWFADWVSGQAMQMLNPATPPSVVETTLDPALQGVAEQAIENVMRRDGGKGNASQAALVAMTADGAVLAMVGGRDYDTSQFNRAFQARRQAGSLFKLFVYLAAFERGFTPDDVLIDQPVRVGTWEPANFENFYRGPVDLRTAFAQSINSISVQLASSVGWGRVVDVARSMGITSPMLPVPSLALGAADVSLLEMTAAFAAVAADKARVQPYGVRRITVADQVLETRPADQPAPRWDRRMILDVLAAVMRDGTAAGSALDRPSAGKTGTSQEFRDAWFVGFTADIVVGVWVGNDDNSPMDHVTGSRLPARIWHDFMVAADKIKTDKSRRRELDMPPMVQQPPTAQYAAVPGAPGVYVSVLPSGTSTYDRDGDVAGIPTVLDPGTLAIGGRIVRLFGVSGDRRFTSQMQRFIAGREVHCRPIGDGGQHRCEVGGHDLSRVVLYNGGGRSTSEVPANLADAEREARLARRGMWGG